MSSALAQTNQFYMTRAPWDDPETYIRNSAIHYARNVETPLLIRQNDHDEATPFFQGVQYFNLLRGLRKPVVMLQYERSEEHTSELQSLMRISYAIFCLNKKNTITVEKYRERTRHN